MGQVPIFHGHVNASAKLTLAPAEAPQRHKHLRNLAGKNVEVVIRKVRTKRSIDQNAYWHAVPFDLFAEYFGEDIESTKYNLMGQCWGWHYSKLAKRDVPIKPSTSEMTTEEGAHFTDWMIQFGLTDCNGLVIPPPEKAEGG